MLSKPAMFGLCSTARIIDLAILLNFRTKADEILLPASTTSIAEKWSHIIAYADHFNDTR
jgi:hypothetical protein